MLKFLTLLAPICLLSCGQEIPIPSLNQDSALDNGEYSTTSFYCKSSADEISVVNAGKAASIHHFLGTRTYTVDGNSFIEKYVDGACTMTITRNIILNKGNTLGLEGKTYDFTDCANPLGVRSDSTNPQTFLAGSFSNSSTERMFWMVTSYLNGTETNFRLEGNVFDLQEFGCEIADQFLVFLAPND